MTKSSTLASSARFRRSLGVGLFILGAALAVLWARVIVLSAPLEDVSPAFTAPVASTAPAALAQATAVIALTPTRTLTEVGTSLVSVAVVTPTLRPTRTPRPTVAPDPTGQADMGVCKETSGQVVQGVLDSKVSPAEMQYLVYLPPCYRRTDTRYPTIYLIHGSEDDETHWEKLGLFDAMNEGLRAGKYAPAIIILPDGDPNLYTNTSGGLNSYEGQIVSELVPLIDRTYRTDARAEMRGIGGISRGGVWSLEIGFLHPEMFGIMGGHSAALNVNTAPAGMDPLMLTKLPTLKKQRLWLDAGEDDYVRPGVDQLHQALVQSGVEHSYQVWPGQHEDGLWAAHLAEYLEFYTRSWRRSQP